MKCDIGHIALLFIDDNLKTHEKHLLPYTEYKVITIFYYIYTKMDSKMKERNCVDKYRSKCKKKRWGFHGYKADQSESMHVQDGEEPILEFCGKNREIICCRRCRKFKDN